VRDKSRKRKRAKRKKRVSSKKGLKELKDGMGKETKKKWHKKKGPKKTDIHNYFTILQQEVE
jgi:hypothetical protein